LLLNSFEYFQKWDFLLLSIKFYFFNQSKYFSTLFNSFLKYVIEKNKYVCMSIVLSLKTMRVGLIWCQCSCFRSFTWNFKTEIRKIFYSLIDKIWETNEGAEEKVIEKVCLFFIKISNPQIATQICITSKKFFFNYLRYVFAQLFILYLVIMLIANSWIIDKFVGFATAW